MEALFDINKVDDCFNGIQTEAINPQPKTPQSLKAGCIAFQCRL